MRIEKCGARALWIAALTAMVALAAGACGRADDAGAKSPTPKKTKVARNGHARGKPGGRLPEFGGARKERPVPVAVRSAIRGSISSYYTATASLAPDNEAQILARVSGVVGRILCEEGDVVRAGKVLLVIDNDEYRYRLEKAEATRADLESKVKRLQEMRSQDLVSAEEFETLRNNLKSARADEGLARNNLSYTRVQSPFDGRVVSRSVNVGQTVNVGTPLFTVADFNPLLARVFVPARAFRRIQIDQPVRLTLESNGDRLQGHVKLVSPTIDPSSGTIKVTIEVTKHPDTVRPGDFAQVRVVTERRDNRVLVPRESVVNDRGDRVVYVAADSTAERRVVEVGFEDDEHAEIISGIAAGEPVVVRGQRTLKHGAPIRVLDENRVAGHARDDGKGS